MWPIICDSLHHLDLGELGVKHICTKRNLFLTDSCQCVVCKRCQECCTDKELCKDCADNFENATVPRFSHFQAYIPVCPRGYTDCVGDPAYIKYHYPKWYKELYGDKTPEEAIMEENGCYQRFQDDPDEDYYCYDDEDK